jgi:hypothetical protein
MVVGIPWLQSALNFFLNRIWFFKAVPKYLNPSTLSKDLLSIFILWLHPALDIAVRYVTEAERPSTPLTMTVWPGTSCIVCCIFLCLEFKEADKTFGAHVTPRLYENRVALFNIVLCSYYRICLWPCREGNDRVNLVLVTCIIICSKVRICYYLLTGVKRLHWRDWFST